MAFSFGAAAGSFLGVVIARSKIPARNGYAAGVAGGKNQRSKLLWGRSRCDGCKKQLKWRENIPLVSFFILRGKCRRCRSPIPYWLPLIEIAGGVSGVWIAYWASQTITVITFITIIKIIAAALIAAALTWIFFSDLVYGVVPDLAIAFGISGAILSNLSNLRNLSYLLATVGAAGFFLFLVLITRGRGMGTGDVTLAAFLGFWLGWPKILLAVWFAFIFGAVAGLILIGLKLKRFGQTIPFGPFLIAAAIIAAMVNDNWRILIGL